MEVKKTQNCLHLGEKKKSFLINGINQQSMATAQKGSFAVTRIRKEHPNTCQQLDFYPNLMQNASKCI